MWFWLRLRRRLWNLCHGFRNRFRFNSNWNVRNRSGSHRLLSFRLRVRGSGRLLHRFSWRNSGS